MNKIIKLEFRRAFSSTGFRVSLIASLIFVILHLITEIIPLGAAFNNALADAANMNIKPRTVWYHWLGLDSAGMHGYNYIYYTIVPILAAIPYTASAWEDIKSNYRVQICTRVERKQYFMAKYLAVFTSGGIVCTVPLAFDFLLCCLFLPSFSIIASDSTMPLYFAPWASVFYTNPFGYVLLFLVICFGFSGVYACLGLAVTEFLENRFLIQIFPYLFLLAIGYLAMFLPYEEIKLILYSEKINPALSGGYVWWQYILNFGIFFLITLVLWMRGGKKRELY